MKLNSFGTGILLATARKELKINSLEGELPFPDIKLYY